MPKPEWKRREKATSTNQQKKSSTRTPAKRYREPERSITKALTSSGEYTDGESSDSLDTDASFIDNTPEATPQDEGTEEASSQENTAISEATRSMIHMEMLTSQLNFWDRERRKRSAKRHNQGTRSKRGCYKPRRKSRSYSPTPKRSKRSPTKVLSEEITTSSHGKIPRMGARHRSTNKTHTVTTRQQVDRPPIPPQECDPPPSTEHKILFLCDSWILRAKMSTVHDSFLSFFHFKLSNITGMTEVTNEEPTDGLGSNTPIRMKGSNNAL